MISLRIIRILSIFNYCVSITKHSNLSNVILMPHSRSLCFIPADAMCPVPFIILQEAYNDLLYPKYVFISFIFQWNWIPGSWGLFLIPFWFDVRPPLIQCYNQWTWFPGPWFHFAQDIYKDVSDNWSHTHIYIFMFQYIDILCIHIYIYIYTCICLFHSFSSGPGFQGPGLCWHVFFPNFSCSG